MNEWTDVPALGVKGNITTEKLRPWCGWSAENWPKCCRLSPAGEPAGNQPCSCFKNKMAPSPSPTPAPDEKPFVMVTLVQSQVPAQRNLVSAQTFHVRSKHRRFTVVAAEQAG